MSLQTYQKNIYDYIVSCYKKYFPQKEKSTGSTAIVCLRQLIHLISLLQVSQKKIPDSNLYFDETF